MGYVAGEQILDDEFGAFLGGTAAAQYGINHIMGTGALGYGLGQTELIVPVAGDSITASQWNGLFTAMDNVANHTNRTLTTGTTVQRVAGDPIAIKAALSGDLNDLAADVVGGCTSASAIGEGSELQSSVSSTRWVGSHIVEHSITFANNNALRWFFNAGGTMRMKFTRTGGGAANGSTATPKDDSVDELISAIGNFDLKSTVSTRSGSGETVTTNGLANGIYDCGTGYTVLLKLTQASGTYTSMYIQIEAKLNAAVASATVVTMKYSLVDVDSGDSAYTSGNLSSIDVNINYIGVTDFALHIVAPTTAQGLASVSTIASSAVVSNNTT
jgi:hypothetical protein